MRPRKIRRRLVLLASSILIKFKDKLKGKDMELNSKQKRQRILFEIKDLLIGTAFPLMLQLILSVSVILYADYNDDLAIRCVALVAGEIMLIAAYVIFGRQNGISAYRKSVVSGKKRELKSTEIKDYYKTGEYALWKGIVIGLISVAPFILFQFIQCLAPNTVCEFVLKYAFGWAAYPFIVMGVKTQWLNFVWIIVPIGVHTVSYLWGGLIEKKRQQLVAEGIKGKKK